LLKSVSNPGPADHAIQPIAAQGEAESILIPFQ